MGMALRYEEKATHSFIHRSKNRRRAIEYANIASEWLHTAYDLLPQPGCLLYQQYPQQMSCIGSIPAIPTSFQLHQDDDEILLRNLQRCTQMCEAKQQVLGVLEDAIEADISMHRYQQPRASISTPIVR